MNIGLHILMALERNSWARELVTHAGGTAIAWMETVRLTAVEKNG